MAKSPKELLDELEKMLADTSEALERGMIVAYDDDEDNVVVRMRGKLAEYRKAAGV